MEDSSLFLQWAMSTLYHEHQQAVAVDDDCGEPIFPSLQALREASQAAEMVQELIAEAHPTNSWSSSDGNNNLPPTAMDHNVWPASPNSERRVPSRNHGGTNSPVSWNFSAAAARPRNHELPAETAAATRGLSDPVNGSPPARRGGLKSSGSMAASYGQDHIIVERKRREKINQRFIELSAVIPGLKKMNKASILYDAIRHVKELQEKIKELEAGGRNGRSNETVLVVKRPCLHGATAASDGDGSSLSASSGTPEIEVRFSDQSVMVRIHCENGKSVVVKVLAEIGELHLGIIHANVMPFSASTLIIIITAKASEVKIQHSGRNYTCCIL
ncbi:hypothetical protein PR202_gb17031 [Eleusine coracana subsp. coracana]|uniref:BHLH domain-containing protein n=1 Tax=Eleusine coracana subsp. coracana TaxID=191504 RepID=A0AAV5EZL2_ELECO|nr:hypothetical protein QOZ80_6BG0471880 [Eleusine coracana subsp. coracana]GJN28859.1 hypothetical protein PR202_gb17031 [Eleusine coracana subsp. coracana]